MSLRMDFETLTRELSRCIRQYLVTADLDCSRGLSLRRETIENGDASFHTISGEVDRLIEHGLLIKHGQMLRVEPLLWSSMKEEQHPRTIKRAHRAMNKEPANGTVAAASGLIPCLPKRQKPTSILRLCASVNSNRTHTCRFIHDSL